MLRQMGYSIPRLLGYMSEQAIYMVNSFQFTRSSQAYPGAPETRRKTRRIRNPLNAFLRGFLRERTCRASRESKLETPKLGSHCFGYHAA